MSAMRAIASLLLALLAPATQAAVVQAVDDAGHTVRLDAPARRIVSVAPHLTELLFTAGAGAQVVGAVAYSDHPEAAKRIPRIGDSAQLDLERIVSLRPDLIVVWLQRQLGAADRTAARARRAGV